MDDTNPQTIQAIQNALRSEDVTKLREIAFWPGGFQNNELRRQVWPMLMGLDRRPSQIKLLDLPSDLQIKNDALKTSQDKQQQIYPILKKLLQHKYKIETTNGKDEIETIVDDVKRTFTDGRLIPSEQNALRIILLKIILTMIIMHPTILKYTQGYNLIVSVFITVFIPNSDNVQYLQDCFHTVENATLFYFHKFSDQKIFVSEMSYTFLLQLIKLLNPSIIHYFTNPLYYYNYFRHFSTWFYVSQNMNINIRRFDAFLAIPDPLFPLYFAASYFNSKAREILKEDTTSPSTFLQDLLTTPADNEDELLKKALQLYQRFPPDTLENKQHHEINKQDTLENKQHHEVILLGVVAVLLGVVSGTFAN